MPAINPYTTFSESEVEQLSKDELINYNSLKTSIEVQLKSRNKDYVISGMILMFFTLLITLLFPVVIFTPLCTDVPFACFAFLIIYLSFMVLGIILLTRASNIPTEGKEYGDLKALRQKAANRVTLLNFKGVDKKANNKISEKADDSIMYT